MLRRFMSARTLVAGALSASALLACGDDADQAEELADAGHEHGDHDQREPAKKPSAEKATTQADAGKTEDRAADSGVEKQAPPARDMMGKKASDKERKPETKKEDQQPAADEPDDTMKVSLRFHAKVGKSDFACSHKYAGQGTLGTTVTPLDLRVFVHAVELIQADGAKVPLSLIPREPWQSDLLALLDFEDKTGRCTEGTAETNTAITGTAAKGSYTGIRFVVGVPEALNHQDPARAVAPLKAAATGADGFRFAQIGLAQLNSAGDASGSGLFDLGSTQCSGSVADGNVKCDKPNRNSVELESFDLDKNSIAIDVAKIFAQVDLTQQQACHSVEKSCVPMFSAFGVSFASGQPEKEQLVFSVE